MNLFVPSTKEQKQMTLQLDLASVPRETVIA